MNSPAGGEPGGAAGTAATLHQMTFPDASGSIGLPEGWSIVGAHAGEVVAKGPPPSGLHFDWQISALDPNDPRSRNQRSGVGAAGSVVIPYGTDAGNTFKSAVTQLLRQQHKTPPAIEIVDTKPLSGPQESQVVAKASGIDGQDPVLSLIDIAISPKNVLGGYLITVSMISVPQHGAAPSPATVTAMFKSYKVNNDVALHEIHADMRSSQAFTQSTVANMQRRQDAQDRQFQAFDNNLLDRTVIRDTDLNGHGTVSNDLANALVEANPERFQEVPPSEFVKGIDY